MPRSPSRPIPAPSSAAASPTIAPPASPVSRWARRASTMRSLQRARPHPSPPPRRSARPRSCTPAGLTNFNLDLMYGLPRQDAGRGAGRHRGGAGAGAGACFPLSAHARARHACSRRARRRGLPDADRGADMQLACQQRLAQAGYRAVRGLGLCARPARAAATTSTTGSFGDYLGIGAGAHGKCSRRAGDRPGGRAHAARREPRRYLASAAAAPGSAAQPVPHAELPFEYLLNALRLRRGIRSMRDSRQRTGLPSRRCRQPMAASARRAG